MIKSFKHKGLENFFYTGKKKGIRPEHSDRLKRIIDRLNAANEIRDMNYPGSNLHKLAGDKIRPVCCKSFRQLESIFRIY